MNSKPNNYNRPAIPKGKVHKATLQIIYCIQHILEIGQNFFNSHKSSVSYG